MTIGAIAGFDDTPFGNVVAKKLRKFSANRQQRGNAGPSLLPESDAARLSHERLRHGSEGRGQGTGTPRDPRANVAHIIRTQAKLQTDCCGCAATSGQANDLACSFEGHVPSHANCTQTWPELCRYIDLLPGHGLV